LCCAGHYISAIITTFRSVQASIWGVYACTLRPVTFSTIQRQDRGSQRLPGKILLIVSLFFPTHSPMSCLLSMSSSHSQPRKLVMLCASQLPHSHSCQLRVPCTANGSIPSFLQLPEWDRFRASGAISSASHKLCSLPPSKSTDACICILLGYL